jgi:Carbohydrate esterase, sialic acid-specific acetylesterase
MKFSRRDLIAGASVAALSVNLPAKAAVLRDGNASNNQDIVVVSGQSNAGDGNALTAADLPAHLVPVDQGVKIWNGRAFVTMQNGVNTDPIAASAPTRAATWGPHVEFAYRWRQDNPYGTLYVVHVPVGGSGLDKTAFPTACWCPPAASYRGTRLFDAVTTQLRRAKAALSRPKVRAVLWMQGEADANDTLATANNYATNLPPLLSAMLTNWGDSETKILVGRIDNGGVENQTGGVWHFAPPVQAAQDAVNGSLGGLVTTISTTSYSVQVGQPFHYDGNGQVSLGRDMYSAFVSS